MGNPTNGEPNVYGIRIGRSAQLRIQFSFTLNKHKENKILENVIVDVDCLKHFKKPFNPLNRNGYYTHHLI